MGIALLASACHDLSSIRKPDAGTNDVSSVGTGGDAATGGQPGSGATGGAPSTGGVMGSGGTTATGGSRTGGTVGTGGALASSGGFNGTGGRSNSSGGMTSTGGAPASSGGTVGSGGSSSGGMPGTGGDSPSIDPDLVVWYKFDNDATDSAKYGGTARDATLTVVGASQPGYSSTHQVGTHSLNLAGTSSAGGYARIPNLQTLLPGAVTISSWVSVKSNQNWQQVFNFGTMASTPLIYMFLTTNQAATSPNSVRFSIGTMGNGKEEVINMTTPGTLSLNAWHHLAVVLPAGATYTGTLYIDGMVAGTNTGMTVHPSGIAMPDSFIGRSQYPNDPYFNGYIDDFRVYRRALTAAEITALRAVTQ